MSTNRTITIGNHQVQAEEKDMKQSELQFYPENPRVFNAINGVLGPNPSQREIETHMKGLEHVKTLRQSIEANGGLLEPIIVRKNIVLEGNSRLAAYRILAASDPIKWGMIKCNVLPDDTSDELVTLLLGTIHIIGKTPWSPFEQAGYLTRAINKTRKSIDALAHEMGLSKTSAQAFIRVYQMMVEADDTIPSKWSYYFELDKRKDIKEADENNPTMGIKQTVIDMIKENKIPRAQDLRDIGKVVKAKGENAEEALEGLLNGDLSIQEAKELVQEETKLASLQTKADIFYDFLKKELPNLNKYNSDPGFRFTIKQIKSIIDSAGF